MANNRWLKKLREALAPVANTLFGESTRYRPEQHYMRGPGPKYRAKHNLPAHTSGGNFPRSADILSAPTKVSS